MRKIIFIIILISTVVLSGSFLLTRYKSNEQIYRNFKRINYKLEDKDLQLLIADTPEKWERGLMFFRKLEEVDGMIFVFPDKQYRTFWNKNTLMDLELLWLDGDKVVGKSFLPSIEKSKEIVNVESPKPADKVIELPL